MIIAMREETMATSSKPAVAWCVAGEPPLFVFIAYLDQPELVKRMLEDGQGRVIVDGLDAHQATPLMCEFIVYISI